MMCFNTCLLAFLDFVRENFQKVGKLNCWHVKSVRIRSFSGPCFLAFGLNTTLRYTVFHCIQSKCGKIRTRKTPNTDTYNAVRALLLTLDFLFPSIFLWFFRRQKILRDSGPKLNAQKTCVSSVLHLFNVCYCSFLRVSLPRFLVFTFLPI